MARTIEFAKLSGSGNDFICIDGRDGSFDAALSEPPRIGRFAKTLCNRGLGAGADGIIFALRPEIDGAGDIGARFFEADGSEAELCGNGSACLVHWASHNRWCGDGELKILTPAGIVRGEDLSDHYVRVCIPSPENVQTDLLLTVGETPWTCDFGVIGVPHVVTYVEDVEKVDVAHWGPQLRYHEHFAPRGANANFVQVCGEGRIAVRTWEFGVEGETLACGTGSAAAAIFTAMRMAWPEEYLNGEQAIRIKARSGDELRVYLTVNEDKTVTDVCLETVVRFVYAASLHADLAALALEPC